MTITEEIQVMHDEENLTAEEIVLALNLDYKTVRDALNAPRN